MSKYFSLFPKIQYDIAGNKYSNFQNITNIFFRVRIIKDVLSNLSAYYYHIIRDGDTPEILAEKVYGDAEAHWIILLSNDIVDPQYDWPLNYREFHNYIEGKYGSIATAKTTYHHYEKVVTRENQSLGTTDETRFVVNQEKLTDNTLDVPYDYYEGSGSLPETQEVNTYNLSDGHTVVEVIKRDRITNYDYELALNEKKREIKIIKKDYYGQIMNEFDKITQHARTPFLRRLV